MTHVLEDRIKVTLAADVDSDDLQMTLLTGDGAAFPAIPSGDYVPAYIETGFDVYEKLHVTAVTGDQLTVTRGADGTAARAWVTGTKIFVTPGAEEFSTFAILQEPATFQSLTVSDAAPTGDLFDIQVGGSSVFNIDSTGLVNDTLFIDEANNRVGIGMDTPYAQLVVLSHNTGNTRGIAIEHVDNTTAFSQAKFVGRRSRGSHGSPSAVLANDTLSSFNGAGYKATTWSDTVGGFYIYARENWTDTATGTFLTLRGPKPGTTTVQEWARFQSDAAQLTPEWTAAGTTYTALKVSPTNTASAAGSLLLDLQDGGTSMLAVNKSGYVKLKSLSSKPSAPAAGYCLFYARFGGSGEINFAVQMPDGNETILATEGGG